MKKGELVAVAYYTTIILLPSGEVTLGGVIKVNSFLK